MAKQDELFGKNLFAREPNECCRMRKVEPLKGALAGYEAWATGVRREEGPTRADTPLVTFGTQNQDRAAQWNAVANLMRSGYFGESQLEEVDAMMGLPIRDARADADRAEAAGRAGNENESAR